MADYLDDWRYAVVDYSPMKKQSPFQPDWASAPGSTIAEILDERGVHIDAFATKMHLSLYVTSRLILGRTLITPKIAKQLEKVLGASAAFWLKREENYRAQLIRLKKKR